MAVCLRPECCQQPLPCPTPFAAPRPAPCSTCPAAPSCCSILLSELRPLLVPSQPWGSGSALPFPLLLGSWKLVDRQEIHALPAGDSNLVFLLDSLSTRRFLVNTRALVSVLSQFAATAYATASSPRLFTAGGAPLPCFGSHTIPLQFVSRRFSWSFQLTPVSVPILGSDFLCHQALLVEVARACVLDVDSLDVLSTLYSPSRDQICAHLQTAPKEIRKLLSEYPDILSSDGFSASTPKLCVFHDLPMVPGPPVFTKACRLDPDKLASAQDGEGRYCMQIFLPLFQSSSHGP